MYTLLKIWVRVSLKLFSNRLVVDAGHLYRKSGPMILACNHPNAFLDALVVAAYHPGQIHFLARGNAFNNKFKAWLMGRLGMIPVFNHADQDDIATNNKDTNKKCIEILKAGGTLLAFPEGNSKNSTEMLPLKKHAARLAYEAWKTHRLDSMIVQPVCITYNSFTRAPKIIVVRYAQAFQKCNFDANAAIGSFINDFNVKLGSRMQDKLNEVYSIPYERKNLHRIILAVPAFFGYYIHNPLYATLHTIIKKATKDSAFFDSVMFLALSLLYPLFLLTAAIVTVSLTHQPIFWLLLIIIPFTGWSYMKYKASLGYYNTI